MKVWPGRGRHLRPFLLLVVLLLTLSVLIPAATAQNSPPTLTGGTVTPRRSYPNIDYLYTVTYTDPDNDAPTSIRVNIDDEWYDMEQVDTTDTNYTDGKEYSFKKVMGEGSYTVYYSADDGHGNVVTTGSFTLSVTWDVGHYDIIHFIEDEVFPGIMLLLAVVFLFILIICIVLIFVVLQLRKIAKSLALGEGEAEKEEAEPLKEEETVQTGEEKTD